MIIIVISITLYSFMVFKGQKPFPKRQILHFSKLKKFVNSSNFDEKCRKVIQIGRKRWKNVKLLITSNFSFSQSVFKRLVLQTPKKQGLIGKLLRFTRMRETQITASSRSITSFMPLKHRRGMMASFYLKIMFFFTPGIMFIITR